MLLKVLPLLVATFVILSSSYGDSLGVLNTGAETKSSQSFKKSNSPAEPHRSQKSATVITRISDDAKMTETIRQHYSSGLNGWHSGFNNLDLYSLLAGLAFLGLLASLYMYFANQQRATTVVVVNGTGRRRRRDLNDDDQEIEGETFAEILASLGFTTNIPWWENFANDTPHNVTLFKLP